jgi:polysaccharide chain length determinant protein (PEP-CTERM system associated)
MLPGRKLTVDSILRALRLRWWLLAAPLGFGILGGLLVSRFLPSLYRSDAVIQVVPQRVPESYVAATVTERVEDRLRALSQQVLSRTQIEKLITDFGLFPEERRKLPMEDVVLRMTSRVQIEPMTTSQSSQRETQSEAFRVSFAYQDPAVAQKVVERLASFFIDTNAKERGSQADQTSAFLEAQLADARTRLETQEKKLKAFRERNSGRLPTQMQTNMQAIQSTQMALQAMVETLARNRDRKMILERMYADAQADAASATAAPAPVAGSPQPATDAAAGVPANAPPQQRLDAAKRALAQMELRLSEKHPDIIRVKRLISDLERQIAEDAAAQPVSPDASVGSRPGTPEEERRRDRLREMRVEIESLDRQMTFNEAAEKRLRSEIGLYQSRLEAVPGVESEYVALTRDYDTLQTTYRELLSKSENSKMAASLEQRQIGEQFRILDPPRVPLKPSSPDRKRINFMGFAAGLGIGVLFVGLAQHNDPTMRSKADVQGAIELPVLALVPYVATAEDLLQQRRVRVVSWVSVGSYVVVFSALTWFLKLWKFVL